MAKVYLAQGNDAKLAEVLARLAVLDPDDLPMRKKLAQLALSGKDFTAATHWVREALHIDVVDVDVHRMLGEACMARQEFAPAAEEYEVAVRLDPKTPALQLCWPRPASRPKARAREKP